MKRKIIILKILVTILTVLIIMLEVGLSIISIKYLIENNYKLSAIVISFVIILMILLIYENDSKFLSGYKDFEKKEVFLWNKLTIKRILKFMVKYHLYLIYNVIDEIRDLLIYI